MEPIEKRRRETNPVYWLEIRQARRNFFLYAVLGLGLLAVSSIFFIYDFFAVLGNPEDFDWAGSGGWMMLCCYVLGLFLIPLYLSQKLLGQQNDEDMLLQTPLRSNTILAGKLQAAMTLIVCFYGPSLPFTVWLAFSVTPTPFLANIAFSVTTLCLSMIVLGFLSGAKTPMLKGLSIFLCGIFILPCLVPIFAIVNLFLDPTSYDPGEFEGIFWGVCQLLTLVFVAACFIFWMGIATLHRNQNLGHVLTVAGVTVFALAAFLLALLAALEPPALLFGIWLAFFVAFFGSPLAVLFMAMRYNESQKMIATKTTAGMKRSVMTE